MDQSRSRGTYDTRFRPPVISGSEEWRQRTGVAYRSPAQSMQQAATPGPSRKGMNPRMEQMPNPPDDCTRILPCSAPLANPYVPFQRENPDRYPTQRALARGTMYPGLDLPLMGIVNNDKAKTPLTELMALQFAITELALYLDMHPEDREALELFRDYAARSETARAAYEKNNGPLTKQNAGMNGSWDWTCDPWPWDLCQEG